MIDNEKLKLREFVNEIRDKKIILFGAASRGKRVLNNLIEMGIDQRKILFCDNDTKKWDHNVYGSRVISIDELKSLSKDTCIIISSSIRIEINKQLNELGFTNINYFHSLLFKEQNYEKYDQKFLQILQKVGNECYLDNEEKYTIYSSVKAVNDLPGDIAEVGVYKGGSAKLICEIKRNKDLYLFDTFEGLPKTSNEDLVREGWLNDTSLDAIKKYLAEYNGIHFFKGRFPETARAVSSKKFSFVHLDSDIYQSTLDGLKFFWPRMISEGRIVSHDFNARDVRGVRQAFEEFFKDSREKIIEIADTQVMVIK